DPQLFEQPAGERLLVAEQRIEMGRGVEGVAAAAEGAAIAADHVVLLDQQNLHSGARQEVARDQASHSGADQDRVVPGIGGGTKAAEAALHEASAEGVVSPASSLFRSAGRFLPYVSCAATNSPLAIAPAIDSSPASTSAAAISASFFALPA